MFILQMHNSQSSTIQYKRDVATDRPQDQDQDQDNNAYRNYFMNSRNMVVRNHIEVRKCQQLTLPRHCTLTDAPNEMPKSQVLITARQYHRTFL